MKFITVGPQKITGKVKVSGAKNSATRVLAASLLTSGQVVLRNFPLTLEDAKAKIEFIRSMGAVIVENKDKSELEITVPNLSFDSVDSFDLPIRTTYLLAAGALARNGIAKIPYPGGCKIGSRGYDLHIMVWRQLGCKVEEQQDYILVEGMLSGGVIDFPISTVGGTENALMCAVVANGETLIRNAYITPEVSDLISFLREMGAHIVQEGSSHIRVNGVNGLLRGASFTIMPDRIEALTWIVLAAVTRSTILIENVPFDTMKVPLIHLKEAGIDIFRNANTVMVSPSCISEHGIQPFELATGTHPGVISDMQSFYAFLGMFANGRSVVFDYRYPERIAYAKELQKFTDSIITAVPGKIVVNGPMILVGTEVDSTDLRGSMAQIMAAICANGESTVNGVELALRGYNNLPDKLETLGVKAKWTE